MPAPVAQKGPFALRLPCGKILPITFRSVVPFVGSLKAHVPDVLVAPHDMIRNVTTVPAARFCKAEIPVRLIADSAFPVLLVVEPQVIEEPISVNDPEFTWYCQMPVLGPLEERLIL